MASQGGIGGKRDALVECGGEERRLVMAQGVQEPQDPVELTGDALH